ncbi:MAG: threonine--tRNA ligase [Acidiferrobacteraceae bacterium]|nr:threonine--tRNA ligase [Acidiferrobacteraceae bacterium]
MLKIRLTDGSICNFEESVTVMQVAEQISNSLARAALAGEVDGKLVDISYLLTTDCTLRIITAKDPEGLDVLRHSTAHLLAQAVKILFPTAQVTIGPVIENGFYYDFVYPPGFTQDNLVEIEAKMLELVKVKQKVKRVVKEREEAISYFKNLGEKYKAEIINDVSESEPISLYSQGEFVDLCRGPHVPNTGYLGAFKLLKVSGAYWRGDSNNEMLQRIYGTAWPSKKELNEYLHQIEEAEKRDHRKLGKQLDLFHFQEDAPGMVFWHPNGWTLYTAIQSYIRGKLIEYGYQEVQTPQLMDRSLWEKSGHWDKFRQHMFTTNIDNRDYAIKPMNCPGHVQIFNQGLKSYRELPIRIAEFGLVHRNEPSGTLHGLLRARRFTQDDAHIFCTDAQLQTEIAKLIDLTFNIYRDFGFDNIEVALSTRPKERVGDDELWDIAEKALGEALSKKNIAYTVQEGEGAFYGPKHEFVLRDSIGRAWQCGTIQVDFSMPQLLGAEYVSEDGSKRIPVMIHRAILGSLERFIGMLIEDTEGKLPTWLAPTQVIIINITEKQANYAQSIEKILKKHGVRTETDLRNEKIGYKIRHHTLRRVPYMLVVGDRERHNESVSVRTREGDDLGTIPVSEFTSTVCAEIDPFSNQFGGTET